MKWKEIEAHGLHLRYLIKVEETTRTNLGFMGVYKRHVAECWMTSGLCCVACGEPLSRFFFLVTDPVIDHEFNPDFEAYLLSKPAKSLPAEGRPIEVLSVIWSKARELRQLPIPHINIDELRYVR
jgi:hypothetical protein